jgi:deoxyribose-phosphate aldolase
VELARTFLEDTNVKVTALVGYPTGAAEADAKRFEAEVSVDVGAQEIEVVLNIGRLRDGDRRYISREMHDLVEAVDERPVTWVIETGWLSGEERLAVCEIALDCGVQSICTGTGAAGPATPAQVQELKAVFGSKLVVKVAGIIETTAQVLSLLEAGAERCGVDQPEVILDGLNSKPPVL